jgi:valyl-tRNA synthetase
MTTARKKEEFPKAYDSHSVEERLYRFWMDKGYFTPTIDPDKKPFVIIMPPPNVTGELHLGHALTATLQDTMTRWHRMRGEPTLWLPGSDHAGIATQVVVERMLLDSDNVSRHQLGREQFVEKMWEWVGKYGSIITKQHQRLGASCDWTREQFTLDSGPGKAVRTTFVNLYRKGLIYRGERIINWCPRCATALSDLEVNHTDEQGQLYYIRYKFQDGDGHLTVATTRPETLLGDTAVAVNPNDDRYKGQVGKNVILPVLGRPIPVVGDDAVDTAFGTGALKVTPGHDATDFEIGKRNGLLVVNVMNLDGIMNQEAGPYEGWERSEARKGIVEQLEREGLLERTEPYTLALSRCDRCNTPVEPLVSKQWFVKMEPLAGPAIQAVKDGRIRIVPQRFDRVYMNWMDNIRDWCISRQLWWGHRIPVWYCDDCGDETVDMEEPTRCATCGSSNLTQDPDVLDTWFSSALWPHSTLGWPDDTEDLKYFYPTTVMETGYDIIFFWVARMIMMGLENTGKVPFHTVYLHGLVRDAQGAKMSKSLGNAIDPLKAINDYGADALRFAVTTGTTPGNDSRLNTEKLESARNFANKLWNASRYVVGVLEGADNLDGWSALPVSRHVEDRWIVSRHYGLTLRVQRLLTDFQFGEAERELYDFIWGEFCDWYIEMAKVRLRAGDPGSLPVLAHVLERTLRLLHPFMPFLTEELWQRLLTVLPREGEPPDSIMVAFYPETSLEAIDDQAEEDVSLVMGVVRAVRNIRAEFKVEPRRNLEALIVIGKDRNALVGESDTIRSLAHVEPLTVLADVGTPPDARQTVTAVVGSATVYVPMGDVVDMAVERRRLEQELDSIGRQVEQSEYRLADGEFTSKAPEEVVERERQRLTATRERQVSVRELLTQLQG